MEGEIKEEPPYEIAFQDVGNPDLSGAGPSRYRKRRLSEYDVDTPIRLPDVTSSSTKAMHFMLRQWGLEALKDRFDEHLIDINVLDYILDVDIIELCRDFPIRYRLVLRRNIQSRCYKGSFVPTTRRKRPKKTIITFTKDPTEPTLDSSEPGNAEAQEEEEEDLPASHFVSVESGQQLNDNDSDATESGREDETRKLHETIDYQDASITNYGLKCNGNSTGAENFVGSDEFDLRHSSLVDGISEKVLQLGDQYAHYNPDWTMMHDRHMMSQYLPPRLLDVTSGFTECEGYIPAFRLRQFSDVSSSDYLFVKSMMEDLWPEGFAGRSVTGRASNNASGRNGKAALPVTPTEASPLAPKIPLEAHKTEYIHDRLLERRILLGDDRIKAIHESKQANKLMGRVIVNYNNKTRYPKKHEKHALALKIIEAFPHLAATHVTPDAPKESYFFWLNGGKGKGPHTGLIETRTANMRKEIPPEERRYQRRKETVNFILSDSIRERATEIATLVPLPQNEELIANGMAECIDLHSCILHQGGDASPAETLLTTFPHLLSFSGKLIQQAFQRLHTYYNPSADLEKFLRMGLLLDGRSFQYVENKYIRGALRIMKKLILAGKKEEADDMSTDEAEASPLIRWLKRKENELDVAVVLRHISERSYLGPHIVCIADVFKEGSMFIVFHGRFIPCGKSASQALDVFFKMFAVLGVPVPVLLKKIHELLMVHLWKISNSCKSVTVGKLISRLNEIEDETGEGRLDYDST